MSKLLKAFGDAALAIGTAIHAAFDIKPQPEAQPEPAPQPEREAEDFSYLPSSPNDFTREQLNKLSQWLDSESDALSAWTEDLTGISRRIESLEQRGGDVAKSKLEFADVKSKLEARAQRFYAMRDQYNSAAERIRDTNSQNAIDSQLASLLAEVDGKD